MKSPPSYECLSEDADDEKLLPHDNCIEEPTVRDKVLNWRCVFAGILIGILFSMLAFITVAFFQPKNKCTFASAVETSSSRRDSHCDLVVPRHTPRTATSPLAVLPGLR